MALTPQQRRRRAYNQITLQQMMAAYKSTSTLSAAASLLATWADSNGGTVFDFLDDSSAITDPVTPANNYTGLPDSKLTITRASNATYFNSSGVITLASSNVLRRDYNPATLVERGALVEEQRTNLLLNSLIDGTNLSTQSVSVSATAYTLSFYGTGTITLSGASTAGPLVGSAAYPTRSSLTFTPSAGTLTLTVSGAVQYAQLEAGSFATSFIPTAGSSATRAADAVSLATSAFNAGASAATRFIEAYYEVVAQTGQLPDQQYRLDGGANRMYQVGGASYRHWNGSAELITANGFSAASVAKVALAGTGSSRSLCLNGGTVATAANTVGFPSSNISFSSTGQIWYRRIMDLPIRLSDANLQTLTT